MDEFVKAFKHIARDVLIYILPGLILATIIAYIVIDIYGFINWNLVIAFKGFAVLLAISYVLGHLILASMELLFVSIPIDKKIKKWLFKKENEEIDKMEAGNKDSELEILSFIKHKDAYDFFVERHTQLAMFRWNLSGSFLIIAIICIVYKLGFGYDNFHLLKIGLFSFLAFVVLLLFSIKTELDGRARRGFLALR